MILYSALAQEYPVLYTINIHLNVVHRLVIIILFYYKNKAPSSGTSGWFSNYPTF